jgi:hypothetical protein
MDMKRRSQQLSAADLLRRINEVGKHRVKTVSRSINGRVDEHFENGRSVGFSFHYLNGEHEYRAVKHPG